MPVTTQRHTLNGPVNLVDWTAPATDGRRPQIAAKAGTQVRVRTETTEGGGTVYTVYVRRKGRIWSNTKFREPSGKIRRAWRPIEFHGKI